ncbi:SUKH-4 family immunity protein [Actinomadura sp. KC345]|uniref:SUKH-4 family immunity protein n=1 Tax=Actinomadura sp. KC345 TaxID=2530371 RepID=UPI00140489C2|nr:SUKH-4 family immunity protein [Actinomadura sp. KC345]
MGDMRMAMTYEQLLGVFGADTVVRVPGASVAHEPTRRWLADVGLPREAANLRLDSASGLPTAAEASSQTLPAAIGKMLVLGTVTEQGGTVLLDGTTGAVYEGYLALLSDARFQPELLASDLSSLVGLMTAVTRMHRDQGEFARFAGRRGQAVAAEMTENLLGVIREHDPRLLDVSSEISGHWRVAAHIAPLDRVAGPGEDLALELPPGLLAKAFEDDLRRYEDADLPAVLTHEPTRRFLREHGLANTNYCLLDEQAQTLTDYFHGNRDAYPDLFTDYFRGHFADDGETLSEHVGNLIRLGSIADEIDLVMEGATGRLLGWYRPEGKHRPVNVDVSAMAFAQWLIRQVQLLDPVQDLIQAEASMITNLTRILAGTARGRLQRRHLRVTRTGLRHRGGLFRLFGREPGWPSRRSRPASRGGGSPGGSGRPHRTPKPHAHSVCPLPPRPAPTPDSGPQPAGPRSETSLTYRSRVTGRTRRGRPRAGPGAVW